MNDPLNLFDKQPVQPKPAPVKASTGISPVFLILAIAFGFFVARTDWTNPLPPRPEPRPAPVVKEGGHIVFISDREELTVEQDLLLRQMDDYCKANSLEGWRSYDDESPGIGKALDYARDNGVEIPFVLYMNKDKEIVSVIPWPDSVEGLGKL